MTTSDSVASPTQPAPKKRVSAKQRAANRANAQNSTGPTSADGKRSSSANALRHGLTAQVAVLPGEDLNAYLDFCRRYVESFQPVGIQEEQLAQSLADIRWRLNRVPQLENGIYSAGFDTFHDQIDASNPLVQAALSQALTFLQDARQFANLTLLASRLTRQYEKELDLLRDLQSQRKQTEAENLRHAYNVCKSYKKLGKVYDPKEDGFVFSKADVDGYIRQRDRRSRARDASELGFNPEYCKQIPA